MELATGHAPYANFSLTNIIIMTMHSPVPELERTFSDVSLLFHFVVVSMLHFPLLYPYPQACLSSIVSQRPPLPMFPSPPSACASLVLKFPPILPSPLPPPFLHPRTLALFPVTPHTDRSCDSLFHPSTALFVTLTQRPTHRQRCLQLATHLMC